jgi:hypothetical protein
MEWNGRESVVNQQLVLTYCKIAEYDCNELAPYDGCC